MGRLAQIEWTYLPLLEPDQRPSTVLSRELARNPEFFLEVLGLVFRGTDEEPGQVTGDRQEKAMLGYRLLDAWQRAPGLGEDGEVDEKELNAWVDAARTLAAAQKREEIADQQIGQVLRFVPDDADGLWPHRAVRNLVERIESNDLETGLEIGLYNSRGVTSRGLTEGGAQERALQIRYLDNAQQLNARWPRTAGMLRRIARSFGEEARLHDDEAELTEDRWR